MSDTAHPREREGSARPRPQGQQIQLPWEDVDSLNDEDQDDPAFEWKLRLIAVPAAFVIALVFHAWSTGHWLQRTFLTMIPHELGHAITGWFCGFATVPGLWKTLIPEGRSDAVMVVLGLGNIALIARGWMTQRNWLAAIGIVLGTLQLLGTGMTSTGTAHIAITFGGDAGAMILGTLLVLCFFVPVGSRLRRGGLRWGLLAIGSAAFVDTAATWWSARSDQDVIPFGEIEGVGLSDPSKLVNVHGWSVSQLVDRYMLVVWICLAVIAVATAVAVRASARRAR
jgi:hypothetical protein